MRRRHRWTLSVLLVACCAAPYAQNRPANQFEVATIKPIVPDPNTRISVGIDMYPGGRVVLSGLSLKGLVGTAFRHSRAQVAHRGEAWIDNETYRIEAKAPADLNITNLNHTLFDIDDERVREMLQALLIDRFRVRVRREARTGDVYELTRTSRPLGLQPAKIPEGREPASLSSSIGYAGGRWVMRFITTEKLAEFASMTVLRAPVVDLTKVNGQYDYTQDVPDRDPKYDGIEHTDSFLRMLTEVGLDLKRTRGPVEWLVIDSASRPSPD